MNLSSFRFSVTRSRAAKLRAAISELRQAVDADSSAVPAKLVASVIGLIWSIASCCHRAASIMVRAITATLSDGLRADMDALHLPLAWIVNRFWSGCVKWSCWSPLVDSHRLLLVVYYFGGNGVRYHSCWSAWIRYLRSWWSRWCVYGLLCCQLSC